MKRPHTNEITLMRKPHRVGPNLRRKKTTGTGPPLTYRSHRTGPPLNPP